MKPPRNALNNPFIGELAQIARVYGLAGWLSCCFFSSFASQAIPSIEREARGTALLQGKERLFKTMERYLVICHISKANNVKQLVKVAIAFGLVPILVVGPILQEETQEFTKQIDSPVQPLLFRKLAEAKQFLSERGVALIGIEIMDNAVSLDDFIFPESYALMPGNEGTGLNDKQKEVSDKFVYIPQYGTGTASLNVHVATTVVLYRASLQSSVPA